MKNVQVAAELALSDVGAISTSAFSGTGVSEYMFVRAFQKRLLETDYRLVKITEHGIVEGAEDLCQCDGSIHKAGLGCL